MARKLADAAGFRTSIIEHGRANLDVRRRCFHGWLFKLHSGLIIVVLLAMLFGR